MLKIYYESFIFFKALTYLFILKLISKLEKNIKAKLLFYDFVLN